MSKPDLVILLDEDHHHVPIEWWPINKDTTPARRLIEAGYKWGWWLVGEPNGHSLLAVSRSRKQPRFCHEGEFLFVRWTGDTVDGTAVGEIIDG